MMVNFLFDSNHVAGVVLRGLNCVGLRVTAAYLAGSLLAENLKRT